MTLSKHTSRSGFFETFKMFHPSREMRYNRLGKKTVDNYHLQLFFLIFAGGQLPLIFFDLSLKELQVTN